MIKLLKIIANFFLGVAFVHAQSNVDREPEIKILEYPTPDGIFLRWAVNTPYAWKKTNQSGFIVEKSLISRNGAPVSPIQKEILKGGAFLPAPKEAWRELFDKNEYAAIIAQALYGESFETKNMDPLQSIMAVNQELEQRYTFAMLAAEQSFEAAELAGWGFLDKEVKPGEKYFYKVTAVDDNEKVIAKEASVFTGIDFYEALPKPVEFKLFFKENKAELNWNYSALKRIYSSYLVERSSDGKTFKQINKYPIFNAEKMKPGKEILLGYTDSIPNGKEYQYRIKGINAFGKVGPASVIKKGKAFEKLKFVPYITGKNMLNDSTVVLQWTFDKKANKLIKGFELVRSNNDRTDFKTVVANIAPNKRTLTYNQLKRINYFKIIAHAVNGASGPSYPVIVQPVDSIPPAIPEGLEGIIDTTGIVHLKWKANKEFDLKGYRVFRANNSKNEFTPVTSKVISNNYYTDTINVKNLNKQVYYKVWAEDQRYNASKLSEILNIDKPDLLAPSPAVITEYKLGSKSVKLKWVKSSSADVLEYEIYRKHINVTNQQEWLQIGKVAADASNFEDFNIQIGEYQYTVIAKDKSGLESKPCQPITVIKKQELGKNIITKFKAVPNREIRALFISWKLTTDDVSDILLYKSTETNPLNLYKTFSSKTKRFEDYDLKINTNYTYAIRAVLKSGIESKLEKLKIQY